MANRQGLLVYADGSCIGNPGPGGWGVVLIDGDGPPCEFSGAAASTTNNRMEITAVIEALHRLPPGTAVTIRSDSQYVIKTMTLGWKRRENLDLWPLLDAETAKRKIRWEWVRGHAGDALNERADELARNAALGRTLPPDARPASPAVEAEASSAGQKKAPSVSVPGESGNSASSNEAEIARALRPLLDEGESLRRCASCGRAFVASGQPPTMLAYCSLAACQLKYRSNR